MKLTLYLFAYLVSLSAAGQLNKPVSVLATGDLMFKLRGTNFNYTGVGLHAGAAFFATQKLQLLVETDADKFFGDKVYYISTGGKDLNRVLLYSVKAGPQLFVDRHLALAATFGQTWHLINAESFSRAYGLQFSATGYIGSRRRLVTRLFMVHNLKTEKISQYMGVGLGYRIY